MKTPWLFALVTAVWFGWMAQRAGRSWISWALGGAVFALVATTLVLGLSTAMFLPMSQAAQTAHRVKSVAACSFVVLVFGWVLSAGLHRQPQALWEGLLGLFKP